MKKITSLLLGLTISLTISAQWQQSGLSTYVVESFAANGSDVFAGTLFSRIHKSVNNGSSWNPSYTGIPSSTTVHAIAINGSTVFAGTNFGVYKSVNSGSNWSPANNGLPIENANAFVITPANILAGLSSGVYLSTDNGNNWDTTSLSADITSFTKSGSFILVSTWNNSVHRSADNGATWTPSNNGLTASPVYCLVTSGTNIFAGANGGVFLSTDNGDNWTPVNTGLTNTTVRALTSSGTNIFAGTSGGGVFLSTNNGNNWSPVNTGLTNLDVFVLTVSGPNVLAGTVGTGVFRRPINEMVIGMEESNPSVYNINLFPNPANNELIVSSPEFGVIEMIEIYNTVGEKIFSQQTVNHKPPTSIDVSALHSGIYFVTVTNEKGNKAVRRFVKI